MTEEEVLRIARCCPFCGGHDLGITEWWTDDGESDAIECTRCGGAAPADAWNHRIEDPDEPGWPPRMQ